MTKMLLTLAIRTADLRSDEVTAVLDFEPDSTVVKGPDRMPPRLRPPDHGWFLERDELDGGDIQHLLRDLLTRARPLLPKLELVRARDPSMSVTVHIAITPFSMRVPLFFERDVVRDLAAFDADLDIDFFRTPDTL